MENRQLELINFVKEKHGTQVRKYTNEPYYNHLLNVAMAAEQEGVRFGFEIGLCHDLLEDTDCTAAQLESKLSVIGYNHDACFYILQNVIDLSDVFTTDAFPYLNRKIRKQCEALRLHTINKVAQIVKCLDLIDNTATIVPLDPGFAVKYIAEKREILKGFKDLPTNIKTKVWNCLLDAEEQLKNRK